MNPLQEMSIARTAGWNSLECYGGGQWKPLTVRGLSPRALRRALWFIETHLTERFTLGDLARSVGVSRFHFARMFRISTGSSPMQYLTSTRVERSKAALMQGGCSICEVAAQFGFCDQSHFTRTFRRLTGLTPSEYVQRMQSRRSAQA